MARNFKDNKKQFSTESIHLGRFIHPADDLLILKLECKDIPYPNSPVLFNKKQIGKIDEVFGPVDDVYASVKLDGNMKPSSYRLESKFEAYKDKFIFKDRFLPREEMEKKKMEADKKRSKFKVENGEKGNNNKFKDAKRNSNDGFMKRNNGSFNKFDKNKFRKVDNRKNFKQSHK